MTTAAAATVTLHAGCVAVNGRGLLILGASGSGKSSLALRLMALGAVLVSDDRTIVTATPDGLVATCPPALAGLIEARGLGILRADAADAAQLQLAVDLGQMETERLPPRRSLTILGRTLDLVLRSQNDHFPESLLLCLQGGRAD